MLKEMPLTKEYLSSLRKEIDDLKAQNASVPTKPHRSAVDRSALESRAGRLLEIKQELAKLLNKPDTVAWW